MTLLSMTSLLEAWNCRTVTRRMRVMIIGNGEARLAVRRGEERGVMCSERRWGGRRLGGDIEGDVMVMSGDVRSLMGEVCCVFIYIT